VSVYSERTVKWFHQSYHLEEETGCLIWHGRIHHGKAVFGVGGKDGSARRAAYAVAYGEVPSDEVKITLTCDNRLCVNVEHFVLTRKSLLVGDGQKYCSKCKEIKRLEEFPPCKTGAGDVFNYCRPCFTEYKRHEYDRRPDIKFLSRLRNYGLTPERYDLMYQEQGGRCAICGTLGQSRGLAIDHDHDTGVVRGLLCSRCNSGIAMLCHNREYVQAADHYLARWEGVTGSEPSQLCIGAM
jgi:hypothetical protein